MTITKTAGSRWDRIRERNLQDPEFRHRYERTRQSIAKTQDVLRLIAFPCEACVHYFLPMQ